MASHPSLPALRPSTFQLAWFGTWWIVGVSVGVIGTSVSVAWGQADASGNTSQASDDGYPGVAPGKAHPPPFEPSGSGRVVTWPGFQMMPGGGSRFFLQVNGAVDTSTSRRGLEFVVTLKNTHIHLRNNRRPLVTRYFNTPVNSARLVRRGRDTALVLQLRTEATPTVTTQAGEGGYRYVLVDFAEGQYQNQ